MEDVADNNTPVEYSAEYFRLKGNEAFGKKEYADAEALYQEAIGLDPTSCSLHTNLATAQFHLGRYEDAVASSDKAITLDRTWTKAYFRKAAALEELCRLNEAFQVWVEALNHCERNVWLLKQYQSAKNTWIKHMRTTAVASINDLRDRYALLTETREKLSTLAIFWNASTHEQRLQQFIYFLNLIGGAGGAAHADEYNAINMCEMPMHNYADFTRERISPWCEFFDACDSEGKVEVMANCWKCLSQKEQTMVIQDLRVFVQGGQL